MLENFLLRCPGESGGGGASTLVVRPAERSATSACRLKLPRGDDGRFRAARRRRSRAARRPRLERGLRERFGREREPAAGISMILSLFPASWTTPTHATTTPAPVFAPARHGRILCTAGTAAASPLAAGAAPVVAAYWDEVCVAQQASSSRRAVLQPTAVDDADLVLEYLTSCGQLCAEEGCEVVAAFVDGAPSAAGDGAERAISLQIDRCDAGGPTLVEGVVAPTDAAAIAAAAADSVLTQKDERTRALESCMDWFTATLIAMDGPTEEQEEENFVLLGRSVLHTKAAEVSFAPTLQEMHRDCWRMVADAPCAAPPQLARVSWRAIPGAQFLARATLRIPRSRSAGTSPTARAAARSSSRRGSPTTRRSMTSRCCCAPASAASSRPTSSCRRARGSARGRMLAHTRAQLRAIRRPPRPSPRRRTTRSTAPSRGARRRRRSTSSATRRTCSPTAEGWRRSTSTDRGSIDWPRGLE